MNFIKKLFAKNNKTENNTIGYTITTNNSVDPINDNYIFDFRSARWRDNNPGYISNSVISVGNVDSNSKNKSTIKLKMIVKPIDS